MPSDAAVSITRFSPYTDGAIRQQMVENLKLSSKTQLPIFFIADTFNRVVFSSQGYTIGLGEQLKNTFNRL